MSVLLVSSQKSDGVNTAAEKLKNELSSSFKCTISTLQMDTLQVWKAKHWRNWIYWAFPNHFAQGPWPCHMLGGCRSSLETSVQHDGWHARADTLGHLIFLSEFFGRTILVEIHPFKKTKNKKNHTTAIQMRGLLLKNAAVLWRLGSGKKVRFCWKRCCTTVCSLW